MIFGIDVGISSVGSCALYINESDGFYQGIIRHLGVRLFEAGENHKTGGALNADYRQHKGNRKRLRRIVYRMKCLQRAFKKCGLITSVNTDSPQFILPQNAEQNIWKLRYEGLNKLLNNNEWASVLYYLVKHRGFQSNSKKQNKDDEETGKAKKAISSNSKLLQENQYQTFGEMAYKEHIYQSRKRNTTGDYSHTIDRAMIEHEIHILFDKQMQFGNIYTSAEFRQRVIALLNKRKPTFKKDSIEKLIEHCNFEPAEKRCVKNSFYAEQFVLWGKLNNFVIQGIMQHQDRPLTLDEKEQIIDKIYAQKELSYTALRKLLKLDDNQRFNLLSYSLLGKSKIKKSKKKQVKAETEQKEQIEIQENIENHINENDKYKIDDKSIEGKTFFSAKAYHEIKNKLGDEIWQNLEQIDQVYKHEILHTIAYIATIYKEDKDFFAGIQESLKRLQQQYDADNNLVDKILNQDVLDKLLNLDFTSVVNLSALAIKKVLPFIQQGQKYDEAIQSAGYEHHSKKPSQNKKYLAKPLKKEIRNPVVYRAINQTVKVINALIDKYGKPDKIHIELARDLTKNFKDRDKIKKEIDENFKENDLARENLSQECGIDATGQDILKFKLYKQQNGQCAYSQTPINCTELFSKKYEIDHILPFSRSFDDSQSNKVLVCIKHNQQKGNRTPYEYLSANPEQWRMFEAWVNSNHSLPYAKKKKLLTIETIFDGFIDRNLNDTRYIAKEIKSRINIELAAEGEDKTVNIQGGITAVLRKKWGLNHLKYNEDGNRKESAKHHALDAAVIAACSTSMVQRMQEYSKAKELKFVENSYIDRVTGEVLNLHKYHEVNKHFPQPYEGFRKELIALLDDNPQAYLAEHLLGHYTKEQIQNLKPILISHMERKSSSGKMHDDTIRSYANKGLGENQSSIRTPLKELSLNEIKDIWLNNGENVIKEALSRQKNLVQKLQEHLAELGDLSQYEKDKDKPKLAKKLAEIFEKPLYLSEHAKEKGIAVKNVTIVNNSQKSGMPVRKGIADRSEMLRLDIFSKASDKGVNKGKLQYFGVPVYAHQAYDKEPPTQINADKTKLIDESYVFCFSLHKNSFIRLVDKDGELFEGYYSSFGIAGSQLKIISHDKNKIFTPTITKAIKFEKKYVDILGKCYNIEKHPVRLPIKKAEKSK